MNARRRFNSFDDFRRGATASSKLCEQDQRPEVPIALFAIACGFFVVVISFFIAGSGATARSLVNAALVGMTLGLIIGVFSRYVVSGLVKYLILRSVWHGTSKGLRVLLAVGPQVLILCVTVVMVILLGIWVPKETARQGDRILWNWDTGNLHFPWKPSK